MNKMVKFSCNALLCIMVVACGGKSSNTSTFGNSNGISEGYTIETSFSKNPSYKGIYKRDGITVLVTDNNKVIPIECYTYLNYPNGWEVPSVEDDGTCEKKDCYIAYINNQYMIFDENGSEMLENGINEYELYPYGSYVYGKTDKGWNVYDLNKYESEMNNSAPLYKKYFKDCSVAFDGATLLGYDGDIYLSRTDEGMLCLFDLSEEERERSRRIDMEEQEQRLRSQLLLMMFMNNMTATQNQISQINDIYGSYNSYSRSRDAIKRDIAKYQERIDFCESHMNDGIAEGMGYSNIIGNYNKMIQERQRELIYAQ